MADHYSARSNQTLEERENSPIIHLKKLNNWVTTLLCFLSIHSLKPLRKCDFYDVG